MTGVGYRSWHITVLVLSLAVVVASMTLGGDDVQVTLFGDPLPPLCLFRNLTGVRCPGCGLTRSFVYMGHLSPLDAFRMHLLGPLLWVFVAAQVPYRAIRLVRGAG